MTNKKRYSGLDALRGVNLISMICYHLVWDLVFIFGKEWGWFLTEAAYVWQQTICWLFILLSGFCWSLGTQKLRRGLLVFVAGILITLVTFFLPEDQRVFFGVLTLLGSCMLLLIPFERFLKRIPSTAGLIASLALFLSSRNVNYGYLGFESWNFIRLPDFLYKNYLTAYLGFTQPGFSSADYFSILPWLFLFVAGYFLFRIMNEKNKLSIFSKGTLPILEWIGRHSLLIYMLHQPIIYAVLLLL